MFKTHTEYDHFSTTPNLNFYPNPSHHHLLPVDYYNNILTSFLVPASTPEHILQGDY